MVEKIQIKLQTVSDALQQKDFQGAFEAWRKRWNRCINAEENYFERDRPD